jgi:hypothetical protein
MTLPGEPELVSVPLPVELREQFLSYTDVEEQLDMLLTHPDQAGNLVELMSETQIDAFLAAYHAKPDVLEPVMEVSQEVTEHITTEVTIKGADLTVLGHSLMESAECESLNFKKARVLRVVYAAYQAIDGLK